MLTGRTSVYIDTVKTDNEDDRPQNKHKPPDSVEPSDIVQSVENGGNEGTTNFVLDRSRFGKFIIHFGKFIVTSIVIHKCSIPLLLF